MIIIIFGPTGVGKSEFSLSLDSLLPIEIINGDSAQFYTPLSIGTAKPHWKDAKIPHHLFDSLNEPIHYSAFSYRRDCEILCTTIIQRHHIPLVVGGSGFYCNALMYKAKPTKTSHHYQGTISWEMLKTIDPVRASEIHPHDTYRIERALRIWYTTHQKPSEFKPSFDPLDSVFFIYLDREQSDLMHIIRKRTEKMIAEGWIEEVKNLAPAWKQFIRIKKFIGYPEILDYIEKKQTNSNELIDIIVLRTMQYVKKQRTYWRGLKRSLDSQRVAYDEIDLTLFDPDLYLKQLKKRLSSASKGLYERESRKK